MTARRMSSADHDMVAAMNMASGRAQLQSRIRVLQARLSKRQRRVKRPEWPRTDRQLIAHVCADALATAYSKATVVIGVEQVTVKIPGRGMFYVSVYRGYEDDPL
jgi:hypothetical protein